ncbi:putative bifunctional diguanylate cyclase/phosphodiesterase [Treponema pectinovorum]|uniref:putative bifunctional diguanylate cyclase/phosphodiesterase n=1 Tax=Treponema pectinovorum TaxID=164 RepID=UPI0011C6F15E|nr:bifunctional diguanylate cyclase/phosphodiesterase [Treponema pectinovorum]
MKEIRGFALKHKLEKFFLVLLFFSYIALIFFQASLHSFAKHSIITPEMQSFYIQMQQGVVFVVLIGLIKLVLSTQFVIIGKKIGYWLALIVNFFNIVFVLHAFIIKKEISAFLDVPFSIVSIILCTVIFSQYCKIKRSVSYIQRFSYIDELTGLPNRKERIATITDFMTGYSKIPAFSLLMMDFDNFKFLNETLGHQIGDVMIQKIVKNLQKFIKYPASIGRIDGDEFLIILPGSFTEAEIKSYANELNKIVSKPFHYKDKDYRMTASFGIASYPKDTENPATLLQQVDIALFKAKSHGKNQIEFFDPNMQITLENKVDIEQRLSAAIINNELYMEFQPQYNIPEQKLRGFEALTRWASPAMGHILPQDFIPVAEENGLIVEIGKWVMKEACVCFMKLINDYEEKPMLAINISVAQFRDPDFISTVRKIISETGINPAYLEFEITESVLIRSFEVAKFVITQLKELGITIALDDFGTGYSSLSYLRLLPLDVVKIDKSFIDIIGIVPSEKNIIQCIIEMAHKLQLKVIAEGIENQIQLDYLTQNNCDIIQGNLLGRPAPMAAL